MKRLIYSLFIVIDPNLPLLIPPARMLVPVRGSDITIARSYGWIAFAGFIYAAFAATLGQGIY